MSKTRAELMMERETRIAFGPVPERLFETQMPNLSWKISADEFLLRGTGQHYFYYRVGEGITIQRGAGADPSEESLLLKGSVYSAIASLNGLLPIHASAVAFDGRVFAFTGPAGAGKSTLIAGLGAHGLPMFCDDTLLLDLTHPGPIVCLPGHKRLKLSPESVELTASSAEERVALDIDKYYSKSAAGDVAISLPLGELLFLETAQEPAIVPLTSLDRFARLQDEHYTALLYAGARGFDRASYFSHLARLANALPMSRFARSLDTVRFDEGIKLAADYIMSGGSIVSGPQAIDHG